MFGALLIFVLTALQGTFQLSIQSKSCNGILDGNQACGNAPQKRLIEYLAANSDEARHGPNLDLINVSLQARNGDTYSSDNFNRPRSVGNMWNAFERSKQSHALRSKKSEYYPLILLPNIDYYKKSRLAHHKKKKPGGGGRPPSKPPKPKGEKESDKGSVNWDLGIEYQISSEKKKADDESSERTKLKMTKRPRPSHQPNYPPHHRPRPRKRPQF